MVVAAIEPTRAFLDRSGMGTSTRKVAARLWGGTIPAGDPGQLVVRLYEEENRGQPEPSGSQDMIGLLYPGICRLDYDFSANGGCFPAHIECETAPDTARWLESVIWMVPIAPRPDGYGPLGEKNLDPEWIRRLGRSGRDCFDAITGKDARKLGETMNECMRCWEAIFPHVVRHPALTVDLMEILARHQSRYPGAMYSGCGGGYLYVVSEEPVPDGFQVKVRT